MTTITYDGGTIFPTLVDGFESERESGTVVHPIIGRAAPDVTIRPGGLRTGRLVLLFADEAASQIAEDAHAAGGVFTFIPDERPSLRFSYVPAGRIIRRLSETRVAWVVEVEFHEVIP